MRACGHAGAHASAEAHGDRTRLCSTVGACSGKEGAGPQWGERAARGLGGRSRSRLQGAGLALGGLPAQARGTQQAGLTVAQVNLPVRLPAPMAHRLRAATRAGRCLWWPRSRMRRPRGSQRRPGGSGCAGAGCRGPWWLCAAARAPPELWGRAEGLGANNRPCKRLQPLDSAISRHLDQGWLGGLFNACTAPRAIPPPLSPAPDLYTPWPAPLRARPPCRRA